MRRGLAVASRAVPQGRTVWRLCTQTAKSARVYSVQRRDGSGDVDRGSIPRAYYYDNGPDPFRIELGTTRRAPRVESGIGEGRSCSVDPARLPPAPLTPAEINNRASPRSLLDGEGKGPKAKSSSSKVRLPPLSIGRVEKKLLPRCFSHYRITYNRYSVYLLYISNAIYFFFFL